MAEPTVEKMRAGDTEVSSQARTLSASTEQQDHSHDVIPDLETGQKEGPIADNDFLERVGWDGDDDPQNPMNWSTGWRMGHVFIASSITLLTSLAASMFAPGVPLVLKDFHIESTILAELVVSIYVLGFAIGPLFIAPMSELYGRLILYHICNVLFIVFTVACAVSSSMSMLIVFRFFEGCAGAAPLTLAGATIADLIPQEKRGTAMAAFSLGALLGPVVGPVAGGFLAEAEGWRWVFWVITIAAGVISIFALIFMRETCAVVLLDRKAKRLRREKKNPDIVSVLDSGLQPKALFRSSIVRPFRMLRSPIVFLTSAYAAVCYGYLFLLFTTFTIVFEEQYGFSGGIAGLSYLGVGVGLLFGVLVFRLFSDKLVKVLSQGGEMKPEYRLPIMIFLSPLLPIGLFWYGWSAKAHTHWIVPIIGTGVLAIGLFSIFMPCMTYLIDAFPRYAASAISANTLLRSLLGAFLPLAGLNMYDALGLGWGNSLLAFIALAFSAVPLLFYKYGEYLRKRFPVKF